MSIKQDKSILLLNGSPRKNGNTAVLLNWLEEALNHKGQQYKRYDLYNLQIKGCSHCDACQKNATAPGCVIKDDANQILAEMIKADIIIMATPVYCWSFAGCMSSMHDRMYSLFKHDISTKSLIAGKEAVGIFTSGGDEFEGMQYCVAALKDLCSWSGVNYLATIGATNCTTPEELKLKNDLQQEIVNLVTKFSS